MTKVMIAFQLKADAPVRIKWKAQDGHPGDGYKSQITAIILPDGKRITIGANEIVEACIPDPSTADRHYNLSFAGVVTYAEDHPHYAVVQTIDEDRVGYDLEFVRPDGSRAIEEQDFELVARPPALAARMGKRAGTKS
jgi:hypothetical protein